MNKKLNKKHLSLLCGAVFTAMYASSSVAASLPAGTILKLTEGNAWFVNDPDGLGNEFLRPCAVGSCFGMFNRTNPRTGANIFNYTDILPGTDGGLVLGKPQTSGGQESAPSAANSATGQVSAAWNFGKAFGTFFTAPDSTGNLFDDTSCVGAACNGKTELKVLNVAWNGNIIPMGSAAGCNKASLPACTADQVAGIFVSSWTITPVAGSTSLNGASFELIYNQVVPQIFPNYPFQAVLRGTVVIPLPAAVWLFGSGLLGLAAVARRRKNKI